MSVFKMHQTSVTSLHEVGVQFGDKLGSATEKQALLYSKQFFAFSRALNESPSFIRALTDLGKSDAKKRILITSVGTSIKADAIVIDIMCELSSKNWSQTFDFFASVCEFGINLAIISLSKRKADKTTKSTSKTAKAGGLKQAEDELFFMIRTLKDQSTVYTDLNLLRDYLSSESKPLEARIGIVDSLFLGKVDDVSLLLAKYAVLSIHHGGRYVNALQDLSDEIANMRGYKVAHICSTVPPTATQTKRLEQILEDKYQQKMQMNIVVDPNILGGMRVRVGDEMFDNSILNRVNHFTNDVEVAMGN